MAGGGVWSGDNGGRVQGEIRISKSQINTYTKTYYILDGFLILFLFLIVISLNRRRKVIPVSGGGGMGEKKQRVTKGYKVNE